MFQKENMHHHFALIKQINFTLARRIQKKSKMLGREAAQVKADFIGRAGTPS